MDGAQSWVAAGPDEIRWLAELAVDDDPAGFEVGPLPDRVFVLHPLTERDDGKPMDDGYEYRTADDERFWAGNGAEPRTRRLRWADYAQRNGVPMFTSSYWPGFNGALPGVWTDELVEPPTEGDLADPTTRDALLDILTRHTVRGPNEQCTAYYYEFWLLGHPSAGLPALPHILRGPLGTSQELFDRPGYVTSPQNLWPDDHSWVFSTHSDAWATVVSGPVDLVEEILGCPNLEALRRPDLDRPSER